MLAVEGDDQLQITAPSAVTAAVEVPQVPFAFPDTNWVWDSGAGGLEMAGQVVREFRTGHAKTVI